MTVSIAWPFDLTVYGGLVVLFLGHAWLSRDVPMPRARFLYFGLGLVVVWLALETPLDDLGDRYLQSAHMVQHMLLMAVAPPLLLLGLEAPMVARLLRLPGLRALTEPVPAQVIYAAVMVLWHIPRLYDLALSQPLLHVVEHLSFLAAGVIFWWPVHGATSSWASWRLSDPQRIVYLFLGTFPMMGVSLPLQFSRALFYHFYADAPRVLPGITPVVDQTLAGALMMAIDMASSGIAILLIFGRWLGSGLRADLEQTVPGGEQGEVDMAGQEPAQGEGCDQVQVPRARPQLGREPAPPVHGHPG